ncbi:hypothetical protein D3C86_813540 [compost metagenome]
MVLLVSAADRQGGGRIEVEFQATVDHRALVLGVVDKGFVVLVRGDETPAHGARIIQRPGDVHRGAVVVIRTGGQFAAEGEGIEGALAHHVDRTAGFAGPLIQARWTAQHFDPIVHRQIERGGHVALAGGLRDAVDLHLIHEEAAHIDVIEAGTRVVGLDRDPGDLAHGVLQAVHVLVVHALARDHRHRLRDVLELDVALADADFVGGVGMGVFGGDAQ